RGCWASAAVSESTEPTPEAQHPRAPLGMDAPEPAPSAEPDAVASAPSELPEPAAPEAPAEPPSSTSSSTAAEGVGADGLPRLAPLPGTVARNAPKRS
ncbi:2-oxoglutarate dehydrogenase, E2 component, dihydrolipoamide succinyltransferase, partial [Myxococcus sp. AM011]|nr:2-oxoglutarate dehydrogenase, E2 component, dihydrolipoamide succinyltransferase [Myxococcus sp. AM011]